MRKYFLTGLLVLVPLAITAWVLSLIISTLDQSLLIVPEAWQPRTVFGMDIPGFGAILTLAIVFLTGVPGGDVKNHLVGDYVSVYVPTTPNPTSGFFLMMERSKVVELNMTVDAALKHIVSMGVVAPE